MSKNEATCAEEILRAKYIKELLRANRYREALDIIVEHAEYPDVIRDVYQEFVAKMEELEGEE